MVILTFCLICLQFLGPLKNAEADFIRLLWEQNVPLIVMVTKVVEDKAVSKYFQCCQNILYSHQMYVLNNKQCIL